MIPAKKILNTLSEHWPVLEALIKRFKMGDFSVKDVQNILKQQNPAFDSARIYKETNRLLNQDILIPLAKSSQLELNRAVADFASYLLQDESLGLAEEIHVLVKDLARLGDKLTEAGDDEDYSELSRYSRIMDERVRKIVKLFEHNQNAIFNIVENAKSDESSLSLAKRYRAVIEAFDEYIEPMLEMVDIHGEFQACFERIEEQLSRQLERIGQSGKSYQQKRMLEQLRTRILDMHLIGRESLRQSADMLMPLREELRRNTLVTRQASKVLGLIRKNGVDRILGPHTPHFSSDNQRFSLGPQHQIVAYMATLSEFEDAEYQLPSQQDVAPYARPNIPDYGAVKKRFKQFGGKKPRALLGFLGESYPELEADELLFLYQKLISDGELEVSRDDNPAKITIAERQFRLYPYQAKAQDKAQTR